MRTTKILSQCILFGAACFCSVKQCAGQSNRQDDWLLKQQRPNQNPVTTPKEPVKQADSAPKWDVDRAIAKLENSAEPKPSGNCAAFTRQAIEAGASGRVMNRTNHAKDYGPSLVQFGFREFSSTEFSQQTFKKGDVVVIQAAKGHPSGHMAMYDGSKWISDFSQRDLWGGSIRNSSPAYKVYRYEPSVPPTSNSTRNLGGVIVNPSPKLESETPGNSLPTNILLERPAKNAPSWRITFPSSKGQ